MSSILIRRANVVNSAGGRLPAEFTELAYIESSGTQYIDTGIIPSVAKTTEITMNMARVSSSSYEGMGVNGNVSIINTSGYWRLNGVTTTVQIVDGDYVTIVLKQTTSGRYYSVGGVSGYAGAGQAASSFWIGKLNGVASYGIKAKFKTVAIKENNTLVLDLVPAKRNADDVVGMYDLVSNSFLTNAGTGTFNYGEL